MKTRTTAELEKLRDDATPAPWVHSHTADDGEVLLRMGWESDRGYTFWSLMKPEDARLVEAAHENLAQLLEAKALLRRIGAGYYIEDLAQLIEEAAEK